MMAQLEQIRLEALAHTRIKMEVREGSTVKGHWREYKDHKVWIEEHQRSAYFAAPRVTK